MNGNRGLAALLAYNAKEEEYAKGFLFNISVLKWLRLALLRLRDCSDPPPLGHGADCEGDKWEAEHCEGETEGSCGKQDQLVGKIETN